MLRSLMLELDEEKEEEALAITDESFNPLIKLKFRHFSLSKVATGRLTHNRCDDNNDNNKVLQNGQMVVILYSGKLVFNVSVLSVGYNLILLHDIKLNAIINRLMDKERRLSWYSIKKKKKRQTVAGLLIELRSSGNCIWRA